MPGKFLLQTSELLKKRTAALLSYAIYDVGKSLYFPCGIGYFGGGGFWYLQCCRWSNNYVQHFLMVRCLLPHNVI